MTRPERAKGRRPAGSQVDMGRLRTGKSPLIRHAPGLRARGAGFSLVEMMIVMGIIMVLAMLAVATMARVRVTAQASRCLMNLRNIHVAFQEYAFNNESRFPVTSTGGRSWESQISPYIGPSGAFQCPADTDIFPLVGSSYDWRDSGDVTLSLSGKRWSDAIFPGAIIAYETLPGWHGLHKMSAVRIDGAAQLMEEDEWLANLSRPVISPPSSPASPSSASQSSPPQ